MQWLGTLRPSHFRVGSAHESDCSSTAPGRRR
jgi:hypothetical protein